MVHVYKRSSTPVQPWGVLKVGGSNNVAPDVREKFLILWNAEAVRDADGWHYVFDFEARPTLEKRGLAQLAGDGASVVHYRGDVDWAAWLGEGWEVVGEARRWQILHPDAAAKGGGSGGSVKISGMRIGNGPFALNRCA